MAVLLRRPLLVAVLFLLVAAMVAVLGPAAQAGTGTFTATGDAYVSQANPGGTHVSGALKTDTKAGQDRWSYLRFDVSGVPDGATGALKVRAQSSGTVARVYTVPCSWSEATLTWNNKPAYGAQLASVGSFTSNTTVSFGVGAVANGAACFVLRTDQTQEKLWASREDGTPGNRPQLDVTWTDPPPPPPPSGNQLRWGMFNIPTSPVPTGYCSTNGVKVAVVEMRWESAEPTDDAWSTSYFNMQRAKYDAYRAAGCQVTLNWGMHHPPTFVENTPNAKWIDQNGNVYTGSDDVDLMSNKALRAEAEEYALRVFAEFGPGRDFLHTRVGGSHWGELGYPSRSILPDGTDTYWTFNALATDNPVPPYRPCSGSPSQARAFTDWMLNRVVEFQNWQISAVNAAKAFPATHADPGLPAPLYPGNNMTEAEVDQVVAGNLCSGTVPENDGKFPRGHMFARQVNGVPAGTDVTVWGTWANNPNSTNAILDDLADARGFDVAYENSGPGSVAKVQPTENTCRAAFSDGPTTQDVTCYWIRYGDPGTAEYVTAIASDP